MATKKNYRYKWDWSLLKSGEGGPDLAGFGKYITDKSKGIWAYTGESCYVGHKRAVIRATTLKSMDIALHKLKDWGIIDNLSEGRRGVVTDDFPA
jgi:hypothetical protein